MTGAQFRAARAALGWTMDDAARHLGVGRATVHRAENSVQGVKADTTARIVDGYHKHGISFPETDSHVGVMFGAYGIFVGRDD